MNAKRLAIENFRNQLAALDQLTYSQAGAWKSYTKDIIIKYFGNESKFLTHFTGVYSIFYDGQYFQKDRLDAKEVLTQCLKYIELNGVREEPKQNYLSRLSDGWITGLIFTVLPAIWGAGYFLGEFYTKNEISQEKINLQTKVDSLERTLSVLRLSLANKPAEPKADSISHKKDKQKH